VLLEELLGHPRSVSLGFHLSPPKV
jgi:hypothetical protein